MIERLTPADVMLFTADPRKAALYSEDSFFREGLAEAQRRLGNGLIPASERVGLLLFKPEAVAGRKLLKSLDILASDGFTPLAWVEGRFSGPVIHALWRYQMRRNTLEKIRLYTRFSGSVPYLAVAFRDDRSEQITGAARLSALKGPAEVGERRPHQLRSQLDSPNAILNFIHASDEPADVLREMPILIEAGSRDRFVSSLASQASAGTAWRRLRAFVEALYERAPACDVNPIAAAERIACAIAGPGTAAARDLGCWFDEVRLGGRPLDLMQFEDRCLTVGIQLDDIDIFVFASSVIPRNIDGVMGEIEVQA